jgi:hypothetical protein
LVSPNHRITSSTCANFAGISRRSLTGKEMTMRMMTTTALAAVLALGTPAFVQAQGAPAQADKSQTQSSVSIRSIQVVDVKELPPAIKTQVDEIVSKTSETDMQSLRKSIDGSPSAVTALKDKGMTSAQVVAINIADGVLTMFAKTA